MERVEPGRHAQGAGHLVVKSGELHIDDFKRFVKGLTPSPLRDIPQEQEKYDCMYASMSEETATVSHEPGMFQEMRVDVWPRPNKPVLVAGAGSGVGYRWLKERGYDVHACDISRAAQRFYDERDGFAICPLHATPYVDKAFSYTFCLDVLEHVPEDYIDRSLAELNRITESVLVVQVYTAPSKGIRGMHLTIRPPEWWNEKFDALGVRYAGGQDDGHVLALIQLGGESCQ